MTSEAFRVASGLALTLTLSLALPAAIEAESVSSRLRMRLEHLPRPVELQVQGEPIHAARALPEFYEGAVYEPVWVTGAGPHPRLAELIETVRRADREGLSPDQYHLDALERLAIEARSSPEVGALVDLELLASDSFLLLGAHLVSGRIDPVSFDPEWIAVRREVDLVARLLLAATSSSPRRELDALLPVHPGYGWLRRGLERYRSLVASGGWPVVEEGPALRPGAVEDRVLAVRHRLAVTDSELDGTSEDRLYDEELAAAVKRFQSRHGLAADGVIGSKTLAAMNVSAAERVRQIELNLERWRWLPLDLGHRHVVVNIAGFDLHAVEGDQPALAMRVAVGRTYRRTPVFSDVVRYLVFNPYWEVPAKLAVQDKLPEIRKDPGYLERQGFAVYRGWGEEQRRVDPATIDWASLGAGNFPYRLRQDPGPLNALGRVKFMFPNRFNVYLHDTPGREIFDTAERDVSSGCIRVQKPLELAEWLLAGTDRWNREAIDRAIATGRETVVPLPHPIPVHLLYWTAWTDAEGGVQFRRDIYGRDAALSAALEAGPAATSTRPKSLGAGG